VGLLLESILLTCGVHHIFLAAPKGDKLFANLYLQSLLTESESIPYDLVKMIHNAAFALAQDPFQNTDQRIPRLFTLVRWFTPWLGIDFSNGKNQSQTKTPSLRTGKEFVDVFTSKFSGLLQSWETRQDRILQEEIDELRSTVSQLFSTTEFDPDMIDLVFRKKKRDCLTLDMRDILLYFIQDKIQEIHRIEIPSVPIPCQWAAHKPADLKLFCGSDKSLYPGWRQNTVADFIRSDSQKENLDILGLLKNPIAAEIEMTFGSPSDKSRKILLREIFQYLDKAFKFRPDKIWTDSELYRNIQKAITGISDKSEKEIARFASTWKCESFEEYMRIVSLF
jgi:hypothetical protein